MLKKNNNAKSKHTKSEIERRRWIIGTSFTLLGILVAILVVPWGAWLEKESTASTGDKINVHTEVYFFRPTLKIDNNDVLDGSSCQDSLSSNRADAYRCFVDNAIFDPCFLQDGIDYLDCPRAPTQHLILTTKTTLSKTDNEKAMPDEYPWYIILKNGIECNFFTGASFGLAGARVDYGCNDKDTVLSLPVDKSSETHKIKCLNSKEDRVEICDISASWY